MATKTLSFPTTTRTTRTPASIPGVAPVASNPKEIGRLMLVAETLFATAAIAEVRPDLTLAEALAEAQAMLADTPADAQPSFAELTEMVRALYPGAAPVAPVPSTSPVVLH